MSGSGVSIPTTEYMEGVRFWGVTNTKQESVETSARGRRNYDPTGNATGEATEKAVIQGR